jgi:hypothetical protein
MPGKKFSRPFPSKSDFLIAEHRRNSGWGAINGYSFEKASYQYDNPQAPKTNQYPR